MGPNHVKSGIFLRLQRVRKRYSWINEDSLVVGIPLSILCNSTLLLLGLLSAEYEWWCHWLKECQIQPFWHGLALFASMLCAGRCCLCPSLTRHRYQSYQSWQLSTVETNPPRSTETLLSDMACMMTISQGWKLHFKSIHLRRENVESLGGNIIKFQSGSPTSTMIKQNICLDGEDSRNYHFYGQWKQNFCYKSYDGQN